MDILRVREVVVAVIVVIIFKYSTVSNVNLAETSSNLPEISSVNLYCHKKVQSGRHSAVTLFKIHIEKKNNIRQHGRQINLQARRQR